MPFSKRPKIFYGYWIVAATFLCLFIFSGCGFYAFSLFITSLQADLGWRRSEIMVAWTFFFLIMGVASPFVGRVVDRYGVRKVISIGAFIGGLGFVLLSLMSELWCFYVGYAVIGVGMAAMGTVSASAVVSKWFQRRRGLAIGIMSTGIGVGGLALAPLIGAYLIPSFGWRMAYLVLALLMWVLIPLVLLVIKEKPADLGLCPDGAASPETVDEAEATLSLSQGLTLKMALATSAFWLMVTSFLLNGFCQGGISQNQVPYLQDVGFPVVVAVTALGVVGLGSAIGKFFFGWLCDLIPAKYACAIGLVLQMSGLLILMSVGPASPVAVLFLYAISFGLGIGNWLPTMSVLISTNFGLDSYGALFGGMSFAQYLGASAGPLMAAHIYDTMNTYYWAFIVFLPLYAIATLAVLAIRRPKLLKNFKGE